MSEDLTAFTRVPPQRRRDYDPALDPDYPLCRLAAKYGALYPLYNKDLDPSNKSPPIQLNWRTCGHQVYPPLTPERAAVMAWVPFYWPLLALEMAQPWMRSMGRVRR